MLALVVPWLLAAAIVFTARADVMTSYNYKPTTQADYLAKAGVQQALNWFRSSRYRAVSRGQAPTFYNVTATGSIYNLFTSSTSPVRCIASSSSCPSTNATVQLIGIPGTGSSNYPNIDNAWGSLSRVPSPPTWSTLGSRATTAIPEPSRSTRSCSTTRRSMLEIPPRLHARPLKRG